MKFQNNRDSIERLPNIGIKRSTNIDTKRLPDIGIERSLHIDIERLSYIGIERSPTFSKAILGLKFWRKNFALRLYLLWQNCTK